MKNLISFNSICRLLSLAMILIVLISYYLVLSPSAFPDYENYKTIIANGGYLFDPDEYRFEYFSRWILKGNPRDDESLVDLLAFTSQIITIIFYIIVIIRRPSSSLALVAFTGVAFLTTIIRAAPAYDAIGLIVLLEAKIIYSFLFVLLGISWHDSMILPGVAILFSKILKSANIFNISKNINHMLLIVLILGIIATFFSEIIRSGIISIIPDLVIRNSYLVEDGAHSIIKKLYIILMLSIVLIGSVNLINKIDYKIIQLLISGISIIIFTINGVAGMRFFLFSLVLFFSSIDLKPFLHSNLRKFIYLSLTLTIYIYSYFDILRNTVT